MPTAAPQVLLDVATTQLLKLGDADQQCEALLNGPQCERMRTRLTEAELLLALVNDNEVSARSPRSRHSRRSCRSRRSPHSARSLRSACGAQVPEACDRRVLRRWPARPHASHAARRRWLAHACSWHTANQCRCPAHRTRRKLGAAATGQ
eukprot:7037827-Prymnesium_polylepis.1